MHKDIYILKKKGYGKYFEIEQNKDICRPLIRKRLDRKAISAFSTTAWRSYKFLYK